MVGIGEGSGIMDERGEGGRSGENAWYLDLGAGYMNVYSTSKFTVLYTKICVFYCTYLNKKKEKQKNKTWISMIKRVCASKPQWKNY